MKLHDILIGRQAVAETPLA